MNNRNITPEMAKAELARRKAAREELLNRKQNKYDISLTSYLKPSMPLGVNIASGLMSLTGKNPEQRENIRNISSVATKSQPGFSEKFGQGIGEMLPLEMTGIGAVPGIAGSLARIGATSGYGAAVNPENRVAGAEIGALGGGIGETIPLAVKGIGTLAEKINPVKFARSKISDILENYKMSKSKEEGYFGKAFKDLGNKKVISDPMVKMGSHDPIEYLGFDKSDLSSEAKNLYDEFVKDPIAINLHKLQSQIYKDSIRFKNNPNKTDTYEKSKSIRGRLVTKLKNHLSQDPEALEAYEQGANITRNEVKPYLLTPNLRKIVNEKITELKPKKLESTIKAALEKEKGNVPQNHYLRKALEEVSPKLEAGQLAEQAVPELLKKGLPNFVALAQNPTLIKLLEGLNLGYQPFRMSGTGKFLEK